MPITLSALYLVTLVLCNVHRSLEHETPRRSFLWRRAIDGTRGRKYFDPEEEEGVFDSYGSAGGQYDPYQEKTDFSDIRKNVPGEPGVDYPAYTTLPQTGFTCEGRSRGYYADEISGCQVFHVCHDVLVSSFLCPVGSVFSQKLLTCDWWTKVDCSSSSKYVDVNRNSYQQDDDEMIRNAYAMISLRSGKDVTSDGLVDPDRTGSVTDYQRNPPTILAYSPPDRTGNDLSRDFSTLYRPKERKVEARPSYGERFYDKRIRGRPLYEDSPIIRVHKITDATYGYEKENKGSREDYGTPNKYRDRFQPSYAPTVPTVTTTTRRYYSPTVPTTFRPSTLAYNKLDPTIDSSDYYYLHSGTKSFVTPPPSTFSIHERHRQGVSAGPLKKSDKHSHDYGRQESYEDDYDGYPGEEEEERKPGNLSDRRNNYQAEYAEDFEIRGSVGLGEALHKSLRGISVSVQNSVQDQRKQLAEAQATDHSPVPSTTPSTIESTIKASTSSQESQFPISEEKSESKFQIRVPDLSSLVAPSLHGYASYENPSTVRPFTQKESSDVENVSTESLLHQVFAAANKSDERGKESSTLVDKDHELEIIKSVELEVDDTTEFSTSTEGSFDGANNSEAVNNLLDVVDDLKRKGNISMISLLHLMSELLKLDKFPRPFSPSDDYDLEVKTRSEIQRNGTGREKEDGKDEQQFWGEEDEQSVSAFVPNATLPTEAGRTVVKTEVVPSIGFSIAVLDGPIEPQVAESEEEESTAKGTSS